MGPLAPRTADGRAIPKGKRRPPKVVFTAPGGWRTTTTLCTAILADEGQHGQLVF